MSPNPRVTRKCSAITAPALSNAEGPEARFARLPPVFGGPRGKEGEDVTSRSFLAGRKEGTLFCLSELLHVPSSTWKLFPSPPAGISHHPQQEFPITPQQEFPIVPQEGACRHGALRGEARRAAGPRVFGGLSTTILTHFHSLFFPEEDQAAKVQPATNKEEVTRETHTHLPELLG